MIYIIWGVPGAGKSYEATRRALKEMQSKSGKKVISNYPIYDKKNNRFSYEWRSDLVYENIYNSLIVLDEAYREYNSRQYQKFNEDIQTFFATNRHNGNDVILIAQNPQRIDVVLREICNMFLYTKAFKIPIIEKVLWFKIEGYLLVEDFTQNRKPYFIKRNLFSRKVADAYDTHYYKFQGTEPTLYRWFDNFYDETEKKQTVDLLD